MRSDLRLRVPTHGSLVFTYVGRGMKGKVPNEHIADSPKGARGPASGTIAHESYELSGFEEALGNSRMSVEKVCKVRDEMHFKANDYADDLTMRIYERGN